MSTIVHIDIAADQPKRAKKFYEDLFDWKFEAIPGEMEYYLFETKDLDGNTGVGGGLGKRMGPEQRMTNFMGVDSVDEYMLKVESLGGKIIQPKTSVPGWGYMAVCLDTENNVFGLWQEDNSAE